MPPIAPTGPLLSTKPTVLWFHEHGSVFNHDAVINPEYFPSVRDGQLLRLHFPRPATVAELIVKAALVDRETLARQQHLQISVSKDIAEKFGLRYRSEVFVEPIEPGIAAVDHVELFFKEQYLGRSDMWRVQQSLRGACVYVDKKILFAGVIKATVKRLFSKDREVTSGYINDTTRMIFRSGSAKYFLFIQMSREMWEFDEDGELYFEKVVNNFLPQLFNKWKEEGTNHVVSIVLFTRIFYDSAVDDMVCKTEQGEYFKDFYKVLADWETTDDWMSIIGPLKEEQLKFQQTILTRVKDGRTAICGRISMAYDGNVLEAVNLALNPFDNHFVDRDLMRTGLSIILITPGAGKFTVNKKLLRLTNERMTDNGIAMDLVCLSPQPLHITPLFDYMSSPPPQEVQEHLVTRHRNSPDNTNVKTNAGVPIKMMSLESWDPLYQDDNVANNHLYYAIPHWIDCSFYHHETGRFLKQDKFRTRCKMYELQMMGIMEHDLASISIPFLNQRSNTLRQKRSSSSLNKLTSRSPDVVYGSNGETYLSKSANFSNKRQSFLGEALRWQGPIDYAEYDSSLFKDTDEPRFARRAPAPTTTTAQSKITTTSKPKTSFDGPADRSESSQELRSFKPNTQTWHQGDQRRVMSILSQSQQAGGLGKITFDSHVRKDDHIPRASDIFRGSPPTLGEGVRIRPSRRGTMNSNDVKLASHAATTTLTTGGEGEDDESMVVSSSTVDPVPINNKGTRTAEGRSKNPSPRQTAVSGSLPSMHKHSGNSDLIRTSLNRSSPSHGWSTRNSAARNALINPCNPADQTLVFTSHLRRWLHALPRFDLGDVLVHWRSLTTPACLPLTTDYFPSNEELKMFYNHYMYTVSASEDVNLYQAGDRSLSEHKKTANLLMEMISQRLAQGFQIIVDNTGSSGYQKPVTKAFNSNTSNSGEVLANAASSGPSQDAPSRQPAGTAPASVAAAAGATVAPGSGNAGGSSLDEPGTMDEKLKWKHMVWWLSMGHQVHQLTFDSSGQNVEVRRYVRIINFDTKKIPYKCEIWPKNVSSYRTKTISFNYPGLLYAWNYLDHLVAGYQEDLTDNLRFWRARFIVIPRESLPSNISLSAPSDDPLDEEEKRLALFDTWLQNLRKARWLTPQEREEMQKRRRKELAMTDFGLKITTMDPSAYVSTELTQMASAGDSVSNSSNSLLSSIGSLGQPLGLSKESKSKDIALAMRDSKAGVKFMDRRWHFKIFRNAFIGSEFVDWLISQFDDITTREEAAAFGQTLMDRKTPLFVSSTRRHGFLDGHYFYQLSAEFTPQQPKAWFGIQNSSATLSHSGSTANSPNPVAPKKTHFDMVRSVIIDVDPYKKSDRRETAILHYDTLHNANNCYHFQLNWLGCTAQLVQELVQSWSQKAERCGLLVVEGSVDQAYDDSENNNPFQCPVPITLAVPPPPLDIKLKDESIPDNVFEVALVRHLGFVLDVEGDSRFEKAKQEGVYLHYSCIREPYKYDQYIHRSGVAFVQIRPDHQGFYWVNNRLYTNHTPALVASRRKESSSLMHPELLRQNFAAFCQNEEKLAQFWESAKQSFADHHGWLFENAPVVEPDTPQSNNNTTMSVSDNGTTPTASTPTTTPQQTPLQDSGSFGTTTLSSSSTTDHPSKQ